MNHNTGRVGYSQDFSGSPAPFFLSTTMTNAITITVRFDINRLSPNLRQHWTLAAREKREAMDAARMGYMEAGSPVLDIPVRLDLIVRRGHRMDQDNVWSCMKAIIDAVCRRKISRTIRGTKQRVTVMQPSVIPDDNETWLKLGMHEQKPGRQFKGSEIVILIFTPDETQEAMLCQQKRRPASHEHDDGAAAVTTEAAVVVTAITPAQRRRRARRERMQP